MVLLNLLWQGQSWWPQGLMVLFFVEFYGGAVLQHETPFFSILSRSGNEAWIGIEADPF